ncbi:MAG: D-(-)-3-hydroxybutyrate oligomer hydrolase [Gammaproteobacteria bacterium]|nr:D-(-)-3-hydroxybutyrate oligomer hydrolase [Gammaproteobacteria bacterium]
MSRSDSLPASVVRGSVDKAVYDGIRDDAGNADDLLSAGLNAEGLQDLVAPGFTDPLNPTPAELRRLAIYTNFRAITDMEDGGGFGLFWGPALAPSFGGEVEQGLVPGVEYTALMKKPAGSGNINKVPVAVQIPAHFDPTDPCMLLVPPSGSRGYYGGIAIGEWGLFQGCAVVLPGKATGTGFHLLGTNEVFDKKGVLKPAEEVGRKSQFTVKQTGPLKRFIEAYPDRVAAKHAHSQINPERLWGKVALSGIDFAFWALNDHFHKRDDEEHGHHDAWHRGKAKRKHKARGFYPGNTLVIASGTSNAAGTSLRALENDRKGLIDGLVVIEPNINPRSAGKFVIKFGDDRFTGHGTSLYDNHTMMSVYAACAALSPSLAGTPLNVDPLGAPEGSRATRCSSLKEAGLLGSDTPSGQADEALQILREYGYYEEQDTLLASHEWLNLWRSLNPTYGAAHGRFAVWDNICNISFGATGRTSGLPMPLPPEQAAALFSVSGGVPPTGGVSLINDASRDGPVLENLSISANGLQDLNLDGALCFRYLATGDASLLNRRHATSSERKRYRRVQRGIRETLTTGNLHRTPAMILTGRSDALVFPNYHSRPYYGLNQVIEGSRSRLSYIEITNAQHFEALISTFWRDSSLAVQFVPLHYYLFQALDRMYGYLKGEEDSLPPSQVVRPVPREFKPYEAADAGTGLLPDIMDDPADGDHIEFSRRVLTIPR